MASYNKNNAGVKRIMAEARELERDGSTEYTAKPTEEDLFDWHCTIRGPPDSEFEGGLYHARITLPPEYPFKAPSIMLLTPNGRFELNKKICISFTSYHEDLWQPSWGVRTAIIGLQSFFPVKGEGAMGVGGIEVPLNERKRLAALSRNWVCPHCKQSNAELLPDPPKSAESTESSSTTPSTASTEPIVSNSTPASDPEPVVAAADTPLSNPIPAPIPPPTSVDSSPAAPILMPEPPVATTAQQQSAAAIIPAAAPILATAPTIISSTTSSSRPQAIALPASSHSRPLELTPSTPAARVIGELRPGDHDRAVTLAHNGVHPAVYQDEDGEDGEFTWVEGQRPSPLWLDASIGVLAVLIAWMFVRRFS